MTHTHAPFRVDHAGSFLPSFVQKRLFKRVKPSQLVISAKLSMNMI